VSSISRHKYDRKARVGREGTFVCAVTMALIVAGCARGDVNTEWDVIPCGDAFPGFVGEPTHTYECWHDVDATDLAGLVEAAAVRVLDEHGSSALDRDRMCREQAATKTGDVMVVRGCFAYIDVVGPTQASYYIFGFSKYNSAQLDLIQSGTDPGPFEAVVRIDRTECETAVDVIGCVS